jgi:hypothetical protein
MVNSIGGGVANLNTMTFSGTQPVTDSEREGLGLLKKLTPDDWSVVSASVGFPCGPDENGNVTIGQPMIAWQIAEERRDGQLQGPVTAGHLKGILAAQGTEGGDYLTELSSAIDYLNSQDKPQVAWGADPRLRNIDVSA